MPVLSKSELKQPFELELTNRAATLFSSVYPFADAGAVGSQPALIPDLLGSHDINMTYGAVGGLVGEGDLQLADNGNGQTNTWGQFQGVGSAWAAAVGKNSRVYLVDTIYKASTKNYQYLLYGCGLLVFWTKSTGKLSVHIENASGHRLYVDVAMPVSDGERLVIVAQIDQTNKSAQIIINGTSYVVSANGDPFNQPVSGYLHLGRKHSWHNYYGWDGVLSLFAFGTNFDGSEITEQEAIDLSLDPLGVFQVSAVSGTEQSIVVSSTEQLTQSQLVNILGIGAINAIVSEQKSQSQLVSITEINQLNAITSEQKTQSTLIDISEINSVSAIVCEQLTQSVLVVVTANGAQSVSVIITEQKTQSELVSINEVASVNAIASEQLTQSNLVNVDESSGALISVVIAEQKTQSELVSISAIANINSVVCEQLTQSNIQQISVNVTIDAIICEQLTQSQLIAIVQSNIADALNIDIDQITIEMLTPKYKIEMLTPKYTIEHIH